MVSRTRRAAPVSGVTANSTSSEVKHSADQDADALKRQIAELSATNAQLAEAVGARDAFLAVAAHELRNPMTSIAGYVQLIRRNLRRPEIGLDKLERDLQRLDWVVEDYVKRATVLLDVSRITTGHLQLKVAPVNLCRIIRKVSANFQPAAEHAGSQVELDLPTEPVIAAGDALAVEQIVDNLLSNAIKYGAGKPIVLGAVADQARQVAAVRVSDNGPGISHSDQVRIFQRFERAVKTGEHTGGFGVGLWLVRQLCEAMDGSVAVTSAPGRGATFDVILQLHPEERSV